ncbi:MAG: tetratricopeptide repeat protein [Thermoguttaceae bacterium]
MKRFPGEAEALAVLARERSLAGKSAEAVACWQKCLALNPRFALAHYTLGQIAFQKGEVENAVSAARKAVQLDPDLPGATPFLANMLMTAGRMEEASKVLEAHLRRNPRSAAGHFLLGQTFLQTQQFEKAKKSLERAVAIAPDHRHAYYGLAAACARLGLSEQARLYREKFQSLTDRHSAMARDQLDKADDLATVRQALASLCLAAGEVYFQHGDLLAAEAHWLRAAANDPRDPGCRHALVRLYERADRLPEALGVLEGLRRLAPEEPEYWLATGRAYVRLDCFEAAEQAFQSACRLAPDQAAAYAALARLYVQTGRNLPEAITLARKAVELEPVAGHYLLLGAACERNEDLPGALAAMRRAIQLEPDNPQYRRAYEMLEAHQQAGRGGR